MRPADMQFAMATCLTSDSCYLCIPSKLRVRPGDQRDARGWTHLMHATNMHDEREAMHEMMDGQADIHARDSQTGVDALWLATSNNRAPLVRMLLAAGADATRHGLEKLLEAADAGLARHKQLREETEDIKYLPQLCLLDTWHRLTKEALVAWFDQHGRKVLLEEGKADPTVKDHSGKGVLDVVGNDAMPGNLSSVPAASAMLKAAIAKRQQAQAQAAAGTERSGAEKIAAQLLAEEEAEKAAAKATAAKKGKNAKQQQQQQQKARAKEQKEREERERREQQEREEQRAREQEREKQRRQEEEQERQQQQEGQAEKKGKQEKRKQRGAKSKPHAPPTPPQHSPSQQQQPAPGNASPGSSSSAPASQQQQPAPFASSSSQPASDGRQARAACTVASSRNHTYEELGCVVCMDAARNMVLVPCGHVALCMACCEAVRAARNECPMCRETIVAALELKLA